MSSASPGATYDPTADWTATPAPDPMLSLVSYGPASFTASDLNRFAAWITQAGWQRLQGRSVSEFARFARGRQLIVCYTTSRTLLIQGADVERTRALLGQLAGVQS